MLKVLIKKNKYSAIRPRLQQALRGRSGPRTGAHGREASLCSCEKAFTLIELLVVISIIGFLSTIMMAGFSSSIEKARIAGGRQFSSSMRTGLGYYLVGEWSFNDGTAKDISGYGNDGTIYGATPMTNCISGNCLSFDGLNDYVTIDDVVELRLGKNQTVEAWFHPIANMGSWARIVGKGDTINRNYGLWRESDGDILCQIYGLSSGNCWKNGGIGDDGNAPVGKWTHAVCAYDGNQIKLYLDGINIISCPYSGYPFTSSDPVTIGYASFHNYFNGYIDEVRIYSTALSLSQIQQNYAEGLERHKDLARAE